MKKYLLLLLTPFIFLACNDLPTNFKSPNWDTNLRFPITEKNYKLEEIIKVNNNIQIDMSGGAGNYRYKLISDDYVQNFELQDFLKDQLNGAYENLEFFVATKDTFAFIDIASGASIDSAYMSAGDVELEIDNQSQGPVSFTIGMPYLKDNSGTSFELTGNVNGKSKNTVSKSLANHSYASITPTQLYWRVAMKGNFNGEKVKVSFRIKNTKLKYVLGNIPSKDLAPISRSLALPLTNDVKDFRDKFNLKSATLNVKANYISSIKNIYDVKLKDVKIVGKRNSGGTVNLKTNTGSDNFGEFFIANGNYVKIFNNDNSNISEFLSFMPDSITLFTGVNVNPSNKQGGATESDQIKITVSFSALSNLEINDYTRYDTLDLEIDEDMRKEIRNGRYVKLYYELTNSIPLKNDFDITFADKSFKPLFKQKTITLDGATIGQNNVVIPTSPTPASTFELDSNQIIMLSNSYKVIIGLKTATTKPTGNGAIFFKPDMNIKLKCYGELKYHIKSEK